MDLTFLIYIVITISIVAYSIYEEKLHSKRQIKSIEDFLSSILDTSIPSINTEPIEEAQTTLTNKNSISIDNDTNKAEQVDPINNSNIKKEVDDNLINKVRTPTNIIPKETASEIETLIEFPQKKLTQEESNPSDYNRKEIGELGEALVYNFLEKMKDDSDELFHESKINGNHNAAGYDIKFISKNIEYLIEVKATKGPLYGRIILTSNEVSKMQNCGTSIYCIYRVYDVDLEMNTGKLACFIGSKQINEFLIRECVNNRKFAFN